MRKIVMLMAAFALILSSCNDDSTGPQEQYAEVSFSVNEADFNTLKGAPGTPISEPECSDKSMDFAVITIDGMPYVTEIFFANGKYVTQPIKILMGANDPIATSDDSKELDITRFLVYHGDKDASIDQATLVKAAPEPESDYHTFVNPARALDLKVTVKKFEKTEFAIDVLCFEDLYYQNFGFTWFRLELMTIKSLCFFGDICTGKLDQYMVDYNNADSPYLGQSGNYDLGAVMKVVVSKADGHFGDYDGVNWGFVRDFTNETWDTPGVGDCMQVYWGDYDEVDESFKIDLYVLLPEGNTLTYQLKKTWMFADDAIGTIDLSYPQVNMVDAINDNEDIGDGVVDFVIGECAYDKPDYTFAPHQNLPAGAFQMTVLDGANGFYVQLEFTGLSDGYDFATDAPIGGWCGDKNKNIYIGNTYTVNAYSSLKNLGVLTTGTNLTEVEIQKLNYMFNHIGDVIDGFQYSLIGVDNGTAIQNAIWNITDGTTYEGIAGQLSAMAEANGAGYVPKPGEWAAVFFYTGEQGARPQIMFTVVDP